jgi:xylan 1,4-beta-xylosidase
LLARRQRDFSFDADACLEFNPKSFQELAGLCWRYDERNQYLLAVSCDETRGRTLNVLSLVEGRFSREEGPALPGGGAVYLGLSVRGREGAFRYSTDGKAFSGAGGPLDARVLSDEADTLGFTGAFTGIFCVDTARWEAAADFAFFSYTAV